MAGVDVGAAPVAPVGSRGADGVDGPSEAGDQLVVFSLGDLLAVFVVEDVLVVEDVAGAAANFDARPRRRVEVPANLRNVLYGTEVVNRRTRPDFGWIALAKYLPLGRGADAAVKGFKALGHGEDQPHVADFAQWEALLKVADFR